MPANVHILTSSDEKQWTEYYLRLPAQLRDIHFSFPYHQLYESNGDGKIRLFIYEKEKDFYFYPFLIRPVPHFSEWNDIETVYGYTGPLSTTENPEFLKEADSAFLDFCKKQNVISEFVRFHPLIGNERFAMQSKSISLIHLRDYISVELGKNYSSVEAQYTPANRNKLRKAEKAGITIVQDDEATQFDAFVNIYLDNMKRLNAVHMYFFSPAFFEGLKNLLKKSGTLIHAKMNGEIVGSTVFLQDGWYGHYFLSSATESGRKNAAGNLMLDRGIRWCKSRNIQRLHLGGGLTGSPDDALLQFKKNFSPHTVAFFIGKRIHNKEKYEEVINAWEERNPDKIATYGPLLQRYRI